MSKVITQTSKQKDMKRAEDLIKVWSDLLEEKNEMKLKMAPIDESIKAAEEELIEIGKRNRKEFDKDKNWVFADGYIHIADATKVEVNSKKFSWAKFITEFPDLVALKDFGHKDFTKNFKLKELKKLFIGGDTRKALAAHTIDIKTEDEYEVKKSAAQ